MDGSKSRETQVFAVERSFEGSRFEQDLLAAAYEHAVPVVRRLLARAQDAAPDITEQHLPRQQLVAIGG